MNDHLPRFLAALAILAALGADGPKSVVIEVDAGPHDRRDTPVVIPPAAVAPATKRLDPVFARSGFLHPLATRSGLVVTDDFPPDHAHQHGVFFAWVNPTFRGRPTDFWNQAKRTGRVGHDESRPP